ncbi:hypothetical protein Pfo_013995 [Paulownia fortunei]|nr:hypothetical protein Pfo_013995 [Paulownia fortunei]
MSDAKDAKFSVKVLINKQKNKVLFAEADSDFADVLLSFLTLPLGKIVKVLEKHNGDQAPVLGSITSLYNGLANLDSVHFWTEGGKQMLLNPKSSFEAGCRKLKLNVDDTQPTKYFTCANWDCGNCRYSNVSMYYDTARCVCGKSLRREVGIKESQAADGDCGVFTMKAASFIISDNLQMVSNVAGSVMQTLSNLGITDTDGAELMNVTFGFNEIMDLLKGSLVSRTPLTDLVLNKRQIDSATPKSEPGIILHEIEKESTSNSKQMILKVMVQKSTKKLLFAQAEEDFIDFLFSLLTIPLGGVECLLSSNTSLENIDNLYRSIANINGDKYLKTQDTKTMLLKPKLPHGYISNYQILPLSEESAPVLYYYGNYSRNEEWLSLSPAWDRTAVQYRKGQGNYVKGPIMYMVTDNLTVKPLCMTSSLSILNKLKIPLSDVKELELHIGLKEALSILKASLSSTSALTSSLINPMFKREPKQEH